MGLWLGAETGQISRNTWPHANPRHHATVLMFENMAMINEIASYRERDVNYSGVGLAGPLRQSAMLVQVPSAWMSGTLSMRIPLAKIWIWHICLIEFRRRYDAESDLMNVEIVILAAWQSKNVSTSTSVRSGWHH
jgi:hypothetical protein